MTSLFSSLMPSRRIALILVVIAVVCLLYWPAMVELHHDWGTMSDPTYTHGYLIVAVSFWLLMRERFNIDAASIRPQPWIGLLLLAAGMAWLVAYRSGIQVGFQTPVPALMWGAVWAVFGWAVARLTLFPVGYLYFAVPVWDLINPLVQWGTIFVTRLMLRATGVTTYFDDQYVYLPSGTFQIAGGCSGLSFLIVALALALLIGKLRNDPLKVQLKLIALAIAFALVANWIRVYTIILAGYLTNMQHYLVQVNHYYYGWVLFAVTLVPFFIIARNIGADHESVQTERYRVRPTTAMPVRTTLVALGLTIFALALPAGWGKHDERNSRQNDLELLPAPPAGWVGPDGKQSHWRPEFAGADVLKQGVYSRSGHTVEVAIAAYFVQRQGKELGGYGNSVIGPGMREIATGSAIAGGRTFGELRATDDERQESLVWYAYTVGDRWFTDAMRAQIWYGVRSLAGSQTSRALMLRARCDPGCEHAQKLLEDFVNQGVME